MQPRCNLDAIGTISALISALMLHNYLLHYRICLLKSRKRKKKHWDILDVLILIDNYSNYIYLYNIFIIELLTFLFDLEIRIAFLRRRLHVVIFGLPAFIFLCFFVGLLLEKNCRIYWARLNGWNVIALKAGRSWVFF